MKKSYGNISYNMLKDVVHTDEFKQVWMIKKDDIHVCKDCEFRYICTDCRAFVQKLDDIRSKPLKCGYNPYTGQWEDWQVQEKNQNTIEHYQKQFFHS